MLICHQLELFSKTLCLYECDLYEWDVPMILNQIFMTIYSSTTVYNSNYCAVRI